MIISQINMKNIIDDGGFLEGEVSDKVKSKSVQK